MVASLGLAALAGVGVWSFAEYALHNWGGHLPRGKTEFSREHLTHHARTDYFSPTLRKLKVAVPVVALAFLLAWLAVGAAHAAAFTGGFALFYTLYEVVHRRSHTHAPWEPYGRWIRRHHLHHHFGNPRANHGVTSPIWDLVFRTYERPGVVTIPPRQPLPWCLDEQGEVRPEYAGEYRVMRRAAPSAS